MNTTKTALIAVLASTAASASFAGEPPPVALGVSLGTTLGRTLGAVMSGVDFALGNGPLLAVTLTSLLLGVVIARRKLRR